MNTSELLADYRKTGSEAAFTSLLRQYTNLVYSIAKRRLSDQSLAEEVTQTVFMRLAKSPPNLKHEGELASWLHRTTIHVAIDVWRSETRRRTREKQVASMQTLTADESELWDDMTPHLDEALNQLADEDRQAVLLRFFERKPMRDIGSILGVSEDAAKMRVSRAVDRLRNQLSSRGITCTVLVLATILTQRAVEAAPAHLFASLVALKLAAPFAVGAVGVTGLILNLAKSKAALGASTALVLTIVAVILFRSPGKTNMTHPPDEQPDFSQAQPASGGPQRLSAQPAAAVPTAVESQNHVRFTLRVVDRETGAGLAGARVRAAYFYAGGVGERHDLRTDADGNARIPQANVPGKNVGLNVFVAIEDYVPKAIGFGGFDRPSTPMPDYLLELDPALTVGGTVVDESGWPVAGVTMEARRAEAHNSGVPNTDFQTIKETTDADGRWIFRYVPRDYATVDFYLSCPNFAATRVSVPVGQPESMNTTVVIKRGFVVTGRVTDSENRPVVKATVREHHNYGYRKLSTKTDDDGVFALAGLSDMNQPQVDLVVEAKGLAPQLQTVQLLTPTNAANFVLAPGKLFRGRVADEAGNPIASAVVRTDWCDQLPTRFEWLTHTDAEGRFEWDSAPVETTCFWFEADGYEVIRDRPMLPDGTDYEIKLTRKVDSTTAKH